jgi:hypothetical protein
MFTQLSRMFTKCTNLLNSPACNLFLLMSIGYFASTRNIITLGIIDVYVKLVFKIVLSHDSEIDRASRIATWTLDRGLYVRLLVHCTLV